MPINAHAGQVFRHFRTGEVFSLDFPFQDVARLTETVAPPDNWFSPPVLHFSVSDLLDEIEAGIWLPADPESTFVGRRETSHGDFQRYNDLQRFLFEDTLGAIDLPCLVDPKAFIPVLKKEVASA